MKQLNIFIFSVLGLLMTGCVEDPDDSNLYTFTGETIEGFLGNRQEQFSSFTRILKQADLDQLLSSYGQYTCFAPTNEAIDKYIDSLWNDDKNILTA
jgi:hypothetical protein